MVGDILPNYKPKKCVWCGETFIPKSSRQSECGKDHYWPCPRCGEPVLIKESYKNFMHYSPNGRLCSKCKGEAIREARQNYTDEQKAAVRNKTKATCQERYGVDNPMQNADIQERAHERIKELYGVDNVSQSKEIQDKIKENSLKKYGVSHYSNAPEIRARMVDGMIAKYGVANAMKSPEIQKRAQKTNLRRYGVINVGQSYTIKEKMKATCRKRYGVDYALQAPEIRNQIKQTCLEKYGCYGAPNQIFIDKVKSSPEFLEVYKEFIDNPRLFLKSHDLVNHSLSQVSRYLNLDITTVEKYCNDYQLWDIVDKRYSMMEAEVEAFLKTLDSNIQIIHNCRSVISPKELDFYLPDYGLGIECNPTYTHNSSIPPFQDDHPMSTSYHKMKTDLADKAGIQLFHIFGYEWETKRKIIKSMIRNLLKLTSNRIYARKTEIRAVESDEAIKFLNRNHRQGATVTSVRLGLYYNNELVSLMTFNKPRYLLGKTIRDTENSWELSRFCNKLDTDVIGGASKLFKYFLDVYHPSKIISFSDRAHTSGKLYQILGFKQTNISKPNYVWVNYLNDLYFTRVKCQKRNLRKLFNDPTIDIEHKTEKQIMEEHGFVQVFDSGVIRWEYHLN